MTPSEAGVERAILIADVTGSTPLYVKHGDAVASRIVHDCVQQMQRIAIEAGGSFVRSKGDDVLCVFDLPDQALQAARRILEVGETGDVSLHGALHWGPVVWHENELFGNAVNIVARLASRAAENEVLMSQTFADRLTRRLDLTLRPMGELTLKGTEKPLPVLGMRAGGDDGSTQILFRSGTVAQAEGRTRNRAAIRLSHGAWQRIVTEGQAVTMGRAATCDLVFSEAWISRTHATVTVRDGLVELTDQSAAGCTLTFARAETYFVCRQTVALNGVGLIELGAGGLQAVRPRIEYAVIQTDAGADACGSSFLPR